MTQRCKRVQYGITFKILNTMGKTLTIEPHLHSTYFRLAGLSIKKAGEGDMGHSLCRDESGYYISNDFLTNPRTAAISVSKLVPLLKELHENIQFDKIKIKGHYEKTGEELMALVNDYHSPS